MKYCMKCGVLIEEEKNRFCPLCNTIILKDEEIAGLSLEHLKTNVIITKKEKKKDIEIKEKKNKLGLTAFILLMLSFISIFTLLIIDLSIGFNIDWSIIPIISITLFFLIIGLPFMELNKKLFWYITFDALILSIYFPILNIIINHKISWSYYVTLSIILIWIYLSSVFINKIKNTILKITLNFIATGIFILLVTLGLNNTSAFSKLVLPINGLVFIITIISYLFIRTYIYNWRLIVITLSVNTGILCFGIDLLIQRYLRNELKLTWSFIVLLVLIPFTLFMIYLDNRYKIHKYLVKKFHI